MKDQTTDLVSRLAPQGDAVPNTHCDNCGETQCPILIGDVLEKIEIKDFIPDEMVDILFLWAECGYTKSLQQIIEDSGFIGEGCYIASSVCSAHRGCQELKDPNARALVEFLLTIFPKER